MTLILRTPGTRHDRLCVSILIKCDQLLPKWKKKHNHLYSQQSRTQVQCALKKSSYSLSGLSGRLSGLRDVLMMTWAITQNNSHCILSCTCCTNSLKIPDWQTLNTGPAGFSNWEHKQLLPSNMQIPKTTWPSRQALLIWIPPLAWEASLKFMMNLITVCCSCTSNPVDLMLHRDKGDEISCAWVWPSLLTCPHQIVHAQLSGSAVRVTKS